MELEQEQQGASRGTPRQAPCPITDAAEPSSDLVSCFRTAAGRAAYLAAYDTAASLWTAEFEELEIATANTSTHAIVSGPPDAPPLLLLPGGGMGATTWFPLAGILSQHHRIYALDTPGDAGKSLATTPLLTRAANAIWLTEVLDTLGLERAAFVGHSYGGWLALNLALHAPARVSRLALLAPAASLRPLSLRFKLTFLLMAPLAFSAPTLRILIGSFSAQRHRIPDELHRQLWETRHARPKLSTPTVYSDDELQGVSTPTLLLVGDRESIYSPRAALARARTHIRNLEAELVPDAGHMLPLDQPALVGERLLRFL